MESVCLDKILFLCFIDYIIVKFKLGDLSFFLLNWNGYYIIEILRVSVVKIFNDNYYCNYCYVEKCK